MAKEITADAEDMKTLTTKGPAAMKGPGDSVGMTCMGDVSLSGGCKALKSQHATINHIVGTHNLGDLK